MAKRAVAALSSARRPDGGALRASSGIVQWRPGETATDLLDRVDRRLPDGEGRAARRAGGAGAARGDGAAAWPIRRARRLAMAGAIGSRIARQLDVAAIAEAVVTELQSAVGGEACRLVRLHEDGYVSAIATSSGRGPEHGVDAAAGRGGDRPLPSRAPAGAAPHRARRRARSASSWRSR